MSDLKSKLPDMKEVGSIATKLYKDLRTSVTEIIHDYKKKREEVADLKTEEKPRKKPSEKKEKS